MLKADFTGVINDQPIKQTFSFDKYHEQNFAILAKNIQNKLESKVKIGLIEIAVLCCFQAVEGIRTKQHILSIRHSIVKILSYAKITEQIKDIKIKTVVDDLPTTIVSIQTQPN